MKNILVPLVALISILSCKNNSENKATKNGYPESLVKVFKAHGGLNHWKKLKQLSFEKGNEKHVIDLHSRKTLIKSTHYSLGFDGINVWLQQKDTLGFKGNKDFYYNLYFYFYAMPFVLADKGIVYEKAKPLIFEDVTYPGIKIAYKPTIGTSPDDNYYLYYNPKTFQMEWLAYSVTFFSKKPTDKTNLIRYNDWVKVGGFLLPNSLTWYKKDEKGIPTVPNGGSVIFTNQSVSEEKLLETIFYKTKRE